jgi:hypothetical protein
VALGGYHGRPIWTCNRGSARPSRRRSQR